MDSVIYCNGLAGDGETEMQKQGSRYLQMQSGFETVKCPGKHDQHPRSVLCTYRTPERIRNTLVPQAVPGVRLVAYYLRGIYLALETSTLQPQRSVHTPLSGAYIACFRSQIVPPSAVLHFDS